MALTFCMRWPRPNWCLHLYNIFSALMVDSWISVRCISPNIPMKCGYPLSALHLEIFSFNNFYFSFFKQTHKDSMEAKTWLWSSIRHSLAKLVWPIGGFLLIWSSASVSSLSFTLEATGWTAGQQSGAHVNNLPWLLFYNTIKQTVLSCGWVRWHIYLIWKWKVRSSDEVDPWKGRAVSLLIQWYFWGPTRNFPLTMWP